MSDTLQEMRHYGLHRHFTGGSSVLLFGGGVKRGFLYGETADERPCVAIENPVSVTDLHATILTAMGISPKTAFEIEKRPFYVTEDGKGQVGRRAVRVTGPWIWTFRPRLSSAARPRGFLTLISCR